MSRKDTWEDILRSHVNLFRTLVLLIERGDANLAEERIARQEGEALVIRCIQRIYKKTSDRIHESEYDVIPIKLGQLSDIEAAVMMELCRLYPIDYGVYNVNGFRVEAPGTPLDLIRKRREIDDDEGDAA